MRYISENYLKKKIVQLLIQSSGGTWRFNELIVPWRKIFFFLFTEFVSCALHCRHFMASKDQIIL